MRSIAISFNSRLTLFVAIVSLVLSMWMIPAHSAKAQGVSDTVRATLIGDVDIETADADQLRSLIRTLLARLAEIRGGDDDEDDEEDDDDNNNSVANNESKLARYCATKWWTRDLSIGDTGEDVRQLQEFLNNHAGIRISNSGPGSIGQESDYFGPRTAEALARFQEKYQERILAPFGLATGSGFFGASSRSQVARLCQNFDDDESDDDLEDSDSSDDDSDSEDSDSDDSDDDIDELSCVFNGDSYVDGEYREWSIRNQFNVQATAALRYECDDGRWKFKGFVKNDYDEEGEDDDSSDDDDDDDDEDDDDSDDSSDDDDDDDDDDNSDGS